MPQNNYTKDYNAQAYREIKGGFDDSVSEATQLKQQEAKAAEQQEKYASRPFQMARDYFKKLFQNDDSYLEKGQPTVDISVGKKQTPLDKYQDAWRQIIKHPEFATVTTEETRQMQHEMPRLSLSCISSKNNVKAVFEENRRHLRDELGVLSLNEEQLRQVKKMPEVQQARHEAAERFNKLRHYRNAIANEALPGLREEAEAYVQQLQEAQQSENKQPEPENKQPEQAAEAIPSSKQQMEQTVEPTPPAPIEEKETSSDIPQVVNKKPEEIDFEKGYILPQSIKAKVNKEYRQGTVIGVLEQVLNAHSPEEAAMALIVALLAYGPTALARQLELSAANREALAKYKLEKAKEADATILAMKGMSSRDAVVALYSDFLKAGNDMQKVADNIRKEDPGLLENLSRDKEGNLTKAGMEELQTRILQRNHLNTFGRTMFKQELKDRVGLLNRMPNEVIDTQASSPQQAPLPEEVKPTFSMDTGNYKVAPATPETTHLNTSVGNTSILQASTPQVPTPPAMEAAAEAKSAEGLSVSPEAAKKVENIGVVAAPSRLKMTLKEAQNFNASLGNQETFKKEANQFLIQAQALAGKAQELQLNREGIQAARNMQITIPGQQNVSNLSLQQTR